MGPILPNIYKTLEHRRDNARLDRELSKHEKAIFRAAKSRSKRIGRPFTISLDDFKVMVAAANGRCQATNIEFSNERYDSLKYRPFILSIDRIDSSIGYELKNCQLVCAFYNMAKGSASAEIIHVIFLEYARSLGAEIPDKLIQSKDNDRWRY